MEDWIIDWVLRAALFSLMFGMGLALTTGDFRRIVRLPGPVVAGTLLQLVAMPAIGYGLVLIFDLPALLAVGLVVAAACPGGMLSNTAVYYAGGNTALSITLTATATAVTLFTMPLWIRATLSHYPDIAEAVSIPVFGTAMELGGLTILPVALGMALRNKKPAFVRLERPLTAIGAIGVLAAIALDVMSRPDLPTQEVAISTVPVLLLVGAAGVLGLGLPIVFRQPAQDAVTVSVEICLKNTMLGFVVVSTTFAEFAPNVPIALYVTFVGPLVLAVLIGHRVQVARAGRAGDHQSSQELDGPSSRYEPARLESDH